MKRTTTKQQYAEHEVVPVELALEQCIAASSNGVNGLDELGVNPILNEPLPWKTLHGYPFRSCLRNARLAFFRLGLLR